jgi:A/G-specific adenine glycosylase
VRRDQALAVRRPPHGLLGGLWELPGGEVAESDVGPPALARMLRERTGLAIGAAKEIGAFDYAFTHRALRTTVYRCEVASGRVRLDGWDRHRWMPPASLAELPLGTVTRRAIAIAIGGSD